MTPAPKKRKAPVTSPRPDADQATPNPLALVILHLLTEKSKNLRTLVDYTHKKVSEHTILATLRLICLKISNTR
jgi:hypothetical protein